MAKNAQRTSNAEDSAEYEDGFLQTVDLDSSMKVAEPQADIESTLFNYGMEFQPDVIVHAQGSYIYTASGTRMLDWTSGQMSCILGHGHPEIAHTIAEHAAGLDHLHSCLLSPPVIQLSKRLTGLLPRGLDRAFFLSTGSESNEAAIRIAKLFTNKFEIVGLGASWHGMTGASVGAQYHGGRSGYGPTMPGNLMLPVPDASRAVFRHADGSYNWKAELDYGFELVDRASCGSLAAVILEPILSSGGMHVLPRGYLLAVQNHCKSRGMLLILDEAQTGLGRTAAMFAFEHEHEHEGEGEGEDDDDMVVPDILTLSKTLGNGFPLSAVVTSHAIAQTCRDRGYFFCTTHVNDPLAAAVGLKVLDIVVRDSLVLRAQVLGARLHQALRKLQSEHGCIGDIRGRGLLVGFEIVSISQQHCSSRIALLELGHSIAKQMKALGLWLQFSPSASTFRLAPPLTTTDEQLDVGLKILDEAFRTTPGTRSHLEQS